MDINRPPPSLGRDEVKQRQDHFPIRLKKSKIMYKEFEVKKLDFTNQILRLESADLTDMSRLLDIVFSGYYPHRTEQIHFDQEDEVNIITLQIEHRPENYYIRLEFKSKLEIVEVKGTKYYTTLLKIESEGTEYIINKVEPIYLPIDIRFNIIILTGAIADALIYAENKPSSN